MSQTFDSHDPVTGEVISTHLCFSHEDVKNRVELARAAQMAWADLGFKGRKKVLLRFSKLILSRAHELSALLSRETGKPVSDAQLEITLAAGHIAWAARHAEDFMRTSHRSPGLLLANMSATVERAPVGVVGVIGPWNYPVFTPMGSIAYALAAGNTVVFKPSEYTPSVGVMISELFAEIAPFDNILATVTGLGETGKYLCESGVSKLAFTGSTRTAKLVAATCATTMTPVVLECGGKDPVIVDRDANIKAAADGAIWSAMANAGQSCIGAERVYVHRDVAPKFIDATLEIAQNLRADQPSIGNYGPATMPKQLDIIRGHIDDAIARGGRALLGGHDSVGERFVQPVILVDVPEDSTAMCEETFGPTLVINTVDSMDEAIQLANNSRYGLGAAVWSRRRGKKIAARLECGMVAINSTFSYAGIASVPFGGVKDSGYGRIHGQEGLLEFTYPRTVVRARFQMPLPITSFKRSASTDKLILWATKRLNGRLG